MNRRGAERIPLHERVHGTAPNLEQLHHGETLPPPAPVKRCWVHSDHGRQPGLLLEWRRTAAGWQGRVVHPTLEAAGWVVVEDWITADMLEADPSR